MTSRDFIHQWGLHVLWRHHRLKEACKYWHGLSAIAHLDDAVSHTVVGAFGPLVIVLFLSSLDTGDS